MNKPIAVETNLTPVAELLIEKGYEVEQIHFGSENKNNLDKFGAVVITGMNKDFLGISDTVSKVPVINAEGMTAEEVLTHLQSKLIQ